MNKQEQYIYSVNVLIKSEENPMLESEIDSIIDAFLVDYDVTNKRGQKIIGVSFDGIQIWSDGPKNKNKR